MRNPRAPLIAAALISGVGALAQSAAAEEKFQHLFVFGDSYADTRLAAVPLPAPFPPGLWTVYPIPLAKDLQIPAVVNFAVGGARTTDLPTQLSNFQGSPTNAIGPRDLVTLNIGGNDGIGFSGAGGTVTDAPIAADAAATNAFKLIDSLVKAGGRNFVLGEFSGLSGLQIPAIQGNSTAADAFAKAYFEDMQTKLVPLALSGTRFFMLDLHRLGQQVQDDPSKYGLLKNPLQGDRSQCSPNGLPGVLGFICGGSILSPDQSKYFLGPDGLHLTNAGFKLVADYMANIVLAPDTIAVQPGIVTATTSGFTGSVLGRLDAMRDQRDASAFLASSAAGGPMGLGYGNGAQARPTGPSGRLTAYTMGTFQGGNRSDSFEQVGFDYDATSGTVGLEYSVNRNLIVGLAGNYTSTNADLNNGASIDVDAFQAAAYISYATRQMFAEGLVSYGRHDLDLARPGVIDTVRSSTDANAFAAAARGAYLFDFGSLRAGPIAGLTYIHSRVDGYTEKGDPLLTFNVSAQTLDTLTGNVGVQFRTQFLAGGNLVSPFLNVSLEHQFGDDTRTATTNLTQAPVLPILSPVPSFDTRTYGRIEGGVTFQMGPNVSSTINAASTFARDEGNDYRISAGLNYRF